MAETEGLGLLPTNKLQMGPLISLSHFKAPYMCEGIVFSLMLKIHLGLSTHLGVQERNKSFATHQMCLLQGGIRAYLTTGQNVNESDHPLSMLGQFGHIHTVNL